MSPSPQNQSSVTGKYLFLSDVHLGGFSDMENRRLEQSLIHLIDYAEQHHYQLVFLGDLFDYWMEYPNTVPDLGKRVLARLESFNRSNGPTLYITGNHDNWTTGYLSSLQFDMESNYRIWNIDNRQVLLMHGDGVADPRLQLRRPPLHRMLRHPLFVKIYQAVWPPKTGIRLMKWFSRLTRRLGEEQAEIQRLDRWAERYLKNSETDMVLCGHDHQPRIRSFSFGTYINLGTFYQHSTLVRYNNRRFEHVTWSDDKRRLTN